LRPKKYFFLEKKYFENFDFENQNRNFRKFENLEHIEIFNKKSIFSEIKIFIFLEIKIFIFFTI